MSDSITYSVLLNDTTKRETPDLKKALKYARKLAKKHQQAIIVCKFDNETFDEFFITKILHKDDHSNFCGSVDDGGAA